MSTLGYCGKCHEKGIRNELRMRNVIEAPEDKGKRGKHEIIDFDLVCPRCGCIDEENGESVPKPQVHYVPDVPIEE